MNAGLFLPAITLWQPYASLVACGAKTWETRGQRTNYRGRVAIHAAKVERHEEAPLVALPAIHDALWPAFGFGRRPMPTSVRERLPRGAIVATAELTDCLPIVGHDHRQRSPYVRVDIPFLWLEEADGTEHIDDQLPFGWWEPGRWAWRLDDVKPTTERCPWCWGGGCQAWEQLTAEQQAGWGTEPMGHLVVCPVCEGERSCDPVPARGMPGMWRWRP